MCSSQSTDCVLAYWWRRFIDYFCFKSQLSMSSLKHIQTVFRYDCGRRKEGNEIEIEVNWPNHIDLRLLIEEYCFCWYMYARLKESSHFLMQLALFSMIYFRCNILWFTSFINDIWQIIKHMCKHYVYVCILNNVQLNHCSTKF